MTPEAYILLVEDEPHLRQALRLTLEQAGHRVLPAGDGVEALDLLRSQQVDLILADIVMPRMNGYQLYERVRENAEWVNIPFIFLTARAMDSDVRYGKELGVDDYLTKPIEAADMLAAVRGKLRRARQLDRAEAVKEWTIGSLQIDSAQHRVWMRGEPVGLSAKQFRLLECLAQQVGEVVSPRELVRATHGLKTDREEAGALIRPLVRAVRRKLGYPVGEAGCIENVRGVGYRLIPPND